MHNILVTGGSGFLGSELITQIVSSSDDIIYAVVRGENASAAQKRLEAILTTLVDARQFAKMATRIHVVLGDVTRKDLGMDGETLKRLSELVDVIYHSAAVTDLNIPLTVARKVNVEGTRNVLDVAFRYKKGGRLKKVNHVSTAYIAGSTVCVFREDDFDIGQKFNNTYEQSKFEAENVVRQYREQGLDIDIFRPSIILGRYADGKTTNFRMFYQPLHFFSLGLFDRIPAAGDSSENLINVDTAAKIIQLVSGTATENNMTYHVVSPRAPTLDYVLTVASDYFGFKKPDLVPPDRIDMEEEYSPARRCMIAPYLPYFNYSTIFGMDNVSKDKNMKEFRFPEFDASNLTRLYEYCAKCGFIKRKMQRAIVG